PGYLGRPMQIHLAGDFPKQKIGGLDVRAVLDHTQEKAHETVKARVATFPVANQMFADSASVKLGLKDAVGSAAIDADLVDMALKVGLESKFEKPDWIFEAQS